MGQNLTLKIVNLKEKKEVENRQIEIQMLSEDFHANLATFPALRKHY